MRKMHIMESSIIERDSEELVFDMYSDFISMKWEFPFGNTIQAKQLMDVLAILTSLLLHIQST